MGRGRKPLPEDQKKENVSGRILKNTSKKIGSLAKKQGMSKSKFISQTLESVFEKKAGR